MKNEQVSADHIAAMERHARFGALPDRVSPEHLVEEKAVTPDAGASTRYHPEGSWNYFSCLALDLGL
ncbi:hypothetical protein B046DRAFT_04693 [Streptomyces sp. LamerLS-316]|uniref:hypothetical protein n=1 Tax=unclassified Streptomyces TaxID=2593676 RepID=UPI00082388F7|nr:MULTISPECIES: hypothetical protein [unclassified Streptomyces]MYQ37701.1 hypothetical protein [Streptomyces sp. SID4921]SCK46158.1 hypothetical protein B046DRAFT_04693 [Streptomyces sp. LamerLS-316]